MHKEANILLKDLLKSLRELDFDNEEILELIRAENFDIPIDKSSGKLVFKSSSSSKIELVRVKLEHEKIKSFSAGPAFDQGCANRILQTAKDVTLAENGHLVMSRILFSERELKGYYQFENRFRLTPCISEIRVGAGHDWYAQINQRLPLDDQRSEVGPPYPFLLEVKVPRLANQWLQYQMGLRLLDTYQFVLSTLVRCVLGPVHWPSDRQWMALRSTLDGGIDYHLLTSGIDTEKGGLYDEWSAPACEQVPLYTGVTYYDTLQLYRESQLFVPSNIDERLKAYTQLPQKKKKDFTRAAYWFCLGQQYRSEPSLAVLTFATAIECLLPGLSRQPCETCGKPKGGGPTQQFKKFLAKYAPVSDSLKKYRERIYDLRSMLVHGSHASRVDLGPMSLARDKESQMLLFWLVRGALVNWLADQA